jgi:hypothetical protein
MPSASPNKVIVHPLVLLSAVDHFNRVATRKRVVGILLGEVRKGVVDVTNSFAGNFNFVISPIKRMLFVFAFFNNLQ